MENQLTDDAVVYTAKHALEASDGYEAEAGYCWKWTREVLRNAGVPPSMIPPIGVDAAGAAAWYQANHPDTVCSNGTVPGDVCFFLGQRHGPHGHVGIRIPGNLLAENSTYHAPEGQEDGRGTRELSTVGFVSVAVRLWN